MIFFVFPGVLSHTPPPHSHTQTFQRLTQIEQELIMMCWKYSVIIRIIFIDEAFVKREMVNTDIFLLHVAPMQIGDNSTNPDKFR